MSISATRALSSRNVTFLCRNQPIFQRRPPHIWGEDVRSSRDTTRYSAVASTGFRRHRCMYCPIPHAILGAARAHGVAIPQPLAATCARLQCFWRNQQGRSPSVSGYQATHLSSARSTLFRDRFIVRIHHTFKRQTAVIPMRCAAGEISARRKSS